MRYLSGPASGTTALDDIGPKGRTLEANGIKFALVGAAFLVALIVATLLAAVALPTTSRAATTTRTYITTDDALVNQSRPNDNRGGSPRLLACNNCLGKGTKDLQSYVRFKPGTQALQGVSKAVLTLRADESTTYKPAVFTVPDGSFDEGTITWNNRPGPGTIVRGSVQRGVSPGNLLSYDVTGAVNNDKDGTLVFRVAHPVKDVAGFASKDNTSGLFRPQLKITTGQSAPAPTPPPDPGANACDRTISPGASVEAMIEALNPGQIGCLRGGIYKEGDKAAKPADAGSATGGNVIVQNYPGEKVVFRGQIQANPGAEYLTVRSAPGESGSFVIDGTYGPVGARPTNQGRVNTDAAVTIYADHTNWIGLDITKRNDELASDQLYRTGSGILIGSSQYKVTDTLIEKNRIHNCGVRKGQHDESYVPNFFGRGKDLDNRRSGSPDNHAMYVNNVGGSTIIRDNLIYENGERGIQLYPNADNVLVAGNVIDANGEGVTFNEAHGEVSAGNVVRNNVISNSNSGGNVKAIDGANNRANDNCLWEPNGTSGFNDGPGLSASGNVVENPRYQDRVNFKITNPACLAKYSGTQAR